MLHRMNLHPKPFGMIRSGKKTVELRLYDEKRRMITPGDQIEFFCEGESVLTEVLALHRFASFKELYAVLPLEKCGYAGSELACSSPEDMNIYYAPEQQAQYGVVGIELKLI